MFDRVLNVTLQKQPPKVFYNKRLEISQNSQENTFARVSLLIKLQASGQQLQIRRSGTGGFL